jgi:glycosyltransferase involved in cell wall biosynthesis
VPRRLRVLTLIDRATDRAGGAERFAIGLASHLPQDRFEPWICSSREPPRETATALAAAGIPLVGLGRRAKWDVHRMARLARLLRRERFDILHTHKFASNVWGGVIGQACRVPIIVAHEHTWSYEDDPLRVWLDGHVVARCATKFVAVSAADRDRMITVEKVPAERIVVVPANVYLPRPPAGEPGLRDELGLGPGTPLVAVVAGLRPQKALSVLVRAHALVVERLPDAQLVLAGEGPCRPGLTELVEELGIGDRVHLLGPRQDVDSILRAADVAALSSDFEGTPLFVTECIANSTPLVATAVGGLPDLIEHGKTGWLVPPRDPQALADGLIRLLLHPAERERIANAAAAELLPQLTIEAIVGRFAELYESLAGTTSPGR